MYVTELFKRIINKINSKDGLFKTYTNKTSKTIIGEGINVTINSQQRLLVEKVKQDVSDILNKTNCDSDELLKYVEAANTQVHKLPNADRVLAVLHEEEGFVPELRGRKALYLSLITGNGFKLKTEPMFVIRNIELDKYFILHNFYRWFSYKSGLPGFEYETQKKLKKYMQNNSNDETKKLRYNDIIDIEDAISRDQEATEFVLAYMKQIEGTQNVINKIKNDGSANI